MNKPTAAEAFIAPELALLPALLVLLNSSLLLLRVQHPQLERPDQLGEARSLRAARALHVEISTRRALLRYLRTARRAAVPRRPPVALLSAHPALQRSRPARLAPERPSNIPIDLPSNNVTQPPSIYATRLNGAAISDMGLSNS